MELSVSMAQGTVKHYCEVATMGKHKNMKNPFKAPLFDSESRMRAFLEPSPAMKAMLDSESRMHALLEPSPAMKAMLDSESRMQAFLEPSPAMKAMLDSDRRMRALLEPSPVMKAMLDSESRIHALLEPSPAMKAILDSGRKMRVLLEPSPAMKAILDSESRMRALLEPSPVMKAMLDSESRIHALLEPSPAMKAILDSGRKMRVLLEPSPVMKAMLDSDRRMSESIGGALINRLVVAAESFANVDCNINPDGSIVGEGFLSNFSEVKNVIESCIDRTFEGKSLSTEIRINNFIDNAARHNPIIAKIIIFILLPIIINIITTKFFTETKSKNNPLIQQIKQEVRIINNDSNILNQLRFVSSSSLNVRSGNSTKKRIIGKLYFGDVVKIVEKKKNWSLVQYRDDSDEIIIIGWVFTRYIKKFN